MGEKGIVSWDRIYYAIAILLMLAIITGFINMAVSFIFWILILSLITEIPGFINHHLLEINMGEFFCALLAIHFGGIKIAALAAVYVVLLPIFSRMWKPTYAIKGAISTFIAYALVPVLYFHVFDHNLLWTLYAYTAIMYATYSLQTLLITPEEIFDDIRLAMISLPLAYLTNLVYVHALENWAMGMFKPTLSFPLYMKVLIFAVLGGVAVILLFKKYVKHQKI